MDNQEQSERFAKLERKVILLKARQRQSPGLLLSAIVILWVMLITAGTASNRHPFSAGTAISEAEVNQNLDTLYDVVNGNTGSVHLASEGGSIW